MSKINTSKIFSRLPLEIKEMVADFACKPSNSVHARLMTEIKAYRRWSRWLYLNQDIEEGEIDDGECDLWDPEVLEEIMDEGFETNPYFNAQIWGISPHSVVWIRNNGIEKPETIRC